MQGYFEREGGCFMKKWIKVAVLALIVLSLAGIYYGKNVYGKKDKVEASKELQWETFDPNPPKEGKALPVILELGSPT